MRPGVVVLGNGMAGMACARALAKLGRAPLLIAPGSDVPNRGETLSAAAYSVLEDLGWLDLLSADTVLRVDDRYSVWGGPRLARGFATPEQSSGWQIDRRRLEGSMSAALTAEGVGRVSGKVQRLSQARDSVDLELEDGRTIRAGFVADCTGRASITSGAASERRRLDRLTACYSLLDLANDAEPACATLVEAVTSGWWYSSVLPDRRMFVAFFSDSDLMPSRTRKDPAIWAKLAREAGASSARLASLGLALDHTPQGFASACSIVSSRLVEDRIVRAGDAAAALDPLGSNGLATALWSGVQAARSLDGFIGGDASAASRYERAFLQGVLSQLGTQTMMYASEVRFDDAAFWRRRHASSESIRPGMSA